MTHPFSYKQCHLWYDMEPTSCLMRTPVVGAKRKKRIFRYHWYDMEVVVICLWTKQ